MTWPDWWEWPLEFTPHLFKRMADRDFDPVDLRAMLESARGFCGDVVPGRWVIKTQNKGQEWEVIVEPDETERCLVVITAYGVDR